MQGFGFKNGLRRREFLRLSALTTVGMAIGTGHSFGADPVSLRMSQYGDNSRAKRVQAALDLYKKIQPNTSVTLEMAANGPYVDKLATQFAGGSPPNVVALLYRYVPQYAQQGAVIPLDDYFGKGLDISDLSKACTENAVVDGKTYAVSYGESSYGAYYNETMMKALGQAIPQPGDTWEAFERLSNDISKAAGGKKYGTVDGSVGLVGSGSTFQFFEVYVRQFGKQLFTADGNLGFSQQEAVSWFEMWDRLRKSGGAPPADVSGETGTARQDYPIVKGLTANYFTNANILTSVQSFTKDQLVLTTPPFSNSGGKSGLYVDPLNWISVSKATKEPAAAVDLINFFLNDEGAVQSFGLDFGAPANLKLRKTVKSDGSDKLYQDYQTLVADKYAEPLPPLVVRIPKAQGDVADAWTKAGQDISFNQISINEGVDRFFQQSQKFLKG